MPSETTTMSPSDAVRRYNEIMQETPKLVQKITELEMDRNEHKLVEDTLTPLDPSRRAYRLVGEVLVERTVDEVLPSVKANRENVRKRRLFFYFGVCDPTIIFCYMILIAYNHFSLLQIASLPVSTQLEESIATLKGHVEKMQGEANELKQKYNLQPAQQQ